MASLVLAEGGRAALDVHVVVAALAESTNLRRKSDAEITNPDASGAHVMVDKSLDGLRLRDDVGAVLRAARRSAARDRDVQAMLQDRYVTSPGAPPRSLLAIVAERARVERDAEKQQEQVQLGQLAQLLITANCDPYVGDETSGRLPLHSAALRGGVDDGDVFPRIFAEMERRAADDAALAAPGKARATGGASAIHFACSFNNVPVVRFLLEHGSDPFDAMDDGRTPLHLAAIGGHEELLAALLAASDERTGVDAMTEDGRTALHLAALGGNVPSVRLLMAHGADVDLPRPGGDAEGGTPLHIAAEHNRLAVAKLLLEAGAEPERRTGKRDESPLDLAPAKGHLDMVRLLLAHGSSPDGPGLAAAARKGRTAVLAELLAASSSPGTLKFGSRALSMAMSANKKEAADMLRAAGVVRGQETCTKT